MAEVYGAPPPRDPPPAVPTDAAPPSMGIRYGAPPPPDDAL
jgi:hypothetical protein